MERQEVLASPEIKFLLVRHHPDDIKRVWQEAKDSEVIMLESVGMPTFLKKEFMANAASVAGTNNRFFRYINTLSLMTTVYSADPFWRGIVSETVRSQKELYLIDGGGNFKGFLDMVAADQKHLEALEEWQKGNVAYAYEDYATQIELISDGVILRDQLTLSQIEEAINTNKNWYGKKVAVIQGQSHSQASIDFIKRNPHIKTKRHFTQLIGGSAFTFSHEYRSRKLRGDNASILESVVYRGFLTEFIIVPALKIYVENDFDRYDYGAVIGRMLTESEVLEYIKKTFDIEKNEPQNNKLSKSVYVDFLVGKLGAEIVKKYYKQAKAVTKKLN